MKRLPVRTSATLRSSIDQAGPVSAATRALLWLGADAAGLTISAASQREIAALLAEESLAPGVLAALQRLYHRLTGAGEGDTTRDTSYATTGDTPDAVTRGATTTRAMPLMPAATQPAALAALDDRAAARDDPFADIGMEFEGS